MGLTQEIGNRGEDLAVEYLLSHNFNILHRNWRSGRYEIDIIATKECRLHIIEVKSRSNGSYITPEEAFTTAKFNALFKAADSYISKYQIDIDTQFDLIAISYSQDIQAVKGSSNSPDSSIEVRYYQNVAYPKW